MTNHKRPRRKNIPPRVKRMVRLRQNNHCAECRTIFVTTDKVQFDHRPAIILRPVNRDGTDYMPAQNNSAYIEALHKDCHLKRTVGRIPGAERTITTKGSDAHLAAKFRKLEGKNKPRKRTIITPRGMGPKIPSRPFPKQKRSFR